LAERRKGALAKGRKFTGQISKGRDGQNLTFCTSFKQEDSPVQLHWKQGLLVGRRPNPSVFLKKRGHIITGKRLKAGVNVEKQRGD